MQLTTNYINFNTLIIGGGGAGLTAARSLINYGIEDIGVISKVFPTSSHTIAAKGGINAALANLDDDQWQWHAFDTIKSGDYLCDEDSVNYMCQQAPKAIIDLEKMGLVFSRFDNGKIYQRSYGGQSKDFGKGALAHRACSAKDNTGHAMLNTLYQQCLKNNVRFFNEFFCYDLLIKDNICYGVATIDLNLGKITIFEAKNIIIATGGASQIYQNSTSATICTGDGAGMILRSNLQLQDMEFVQFHPTGLYQKNLLITEAARAEGGYLVNSLGERFMKKYSPQFLDLAPRDIVARAIATEIKENRGCGQNKDHIILKIDHLGKKTIEEKLPGLVNLVRSFAKIDPIKQGIPITPLAHYSMGGIPTNNNCQVSYFDGKTEKTVKNLFSIGEAACTSVHGANRMGCNSLLDLVVFGKLVAQFISQNNSIEDHKINIDDIVTKKIDTIREILVQNQNSQININDIKSELKQNMQKFAGIFRNKEMLEKGLAATIKLFQELKKAEIKNKNLFFNDELINYFEVENLLLQSLTTIYCALERNESRGAHWREDFQKRDDKNWRYHSLISVDINEIAFDFKKKPVRTSKH